METNTALSPLRILSALAGLLLILAGGALAGLAAAAAGSIYYIILVFPVGMGIAGGWLVSRAVTWMRLRDVRRVILLSVLAAVVIYGAFHYGRYAALLLQTWLEISTSEEPVDLQTARVFFDYAMQEETGHPGFTGYMLYKAETGISIGRFYSRNRLSLTSTLAWLYWVLEFGIILWIIKGLGEMQARKPVCETCGRWHRGERHLGGTSPANEALLLDLLRRNDLVELGRLLQKDAGLPSLELYMQRCDACGNSKATLTVRRASLGEKGSVLFSDVSQAILRPGDSTLFLSQLRYELE